MRHFYAAQSLRGFSNEITVWSFEGRATRDAWVEEHRHDGGQNSSFCGAYRLTAREARRTASQASMFGRAKGMCSYAEHKAYLDYLSVVG